MGFFIVYTYSYYNLFYLIFRNNIIRLAAMRKILIITGLIIFSFLVFVFVFFIPVNQPANSIQLSNDTLQARNLLNQAYKLRGSNQDSCRLVYRQAIAMVQPFKQSKSTNHLIGLGYVGIASLNCNMGNYDESLKNVKLAITISEIYSDFDIKAQSINIKGLLSYNQSNYDSAVICYTQAMGLAKIASNNKLQGKIYTNMAIINYLQGKSNEAIESFSKTLGIAIELKDVELITGTYLNMGLVANDFGEYDKAIGYYDKAIETYEKINGKDGLILCYQNLGNLYLLLANYEKAIESINLSLKLSEEIGDKANIAKAHHNKAEVYSRVGDFDQASEEYLISIRQKEKLNDKSVLADGYNGLGTLNFQRNVYDKALEYYHKSLQIYDELKLPRGKSTSYSNIANVYLARHQYQDALNYYLKALQLSTEVNNYSGMADHCMSIGACYSKLHLFDKAEYYLIKALKKKKELSEKEGISMVYLELANSKINEANFGNPSNREVKFENAVQYGLKAYGLAEGLKALPIVNMASHSLKLAYKGLNQDREALKYAEMFISSNDSLFNKIKDEAITYAEARWSVEKHQNLINSLETNKKLQDELLLTKGKETRQQNIIICFGIALLVLVVALAITSAINNRKARDLLFQKQLNNLTLLKMHNVRNRIAPHFIFNTLSSISHSIDDPEKAKNKIGNLSMLLRNVIENIERIAIPMDEELSIVRAFTELQKDKIPAPFNFSIEIDPLVDPKMLIPAMIIQIPVENAIKHGLMPMENGPCNLEIRAMKTESGTKVTISDNGMGLSNLVRKTPGTGSGLKMAMQTIHFLNSRNENKILFTISDQKQSDDAAQGAIAEIFIPSDYSYAI